jgi:predicted dehydrogenase
VTLHVGIIGSGEMGRAYAEIITRYTTGLKLAAIAGGSRAHGLAARFGVQALTPAQLLDSSEIGAVVIATPPSSHSSYAGTAMRAGKHVHVEKPMAVTTTECDSMIGTANSTGAVLSVSSVMRYRDTVRSAKEAIDSGLIGKPRLIRATFEWVRYDFTQKPWHLDDKNGSPSLNCVSHIHDVIRHLMADAAEATSIETSFSGAPPAQTAVSQFRLVNGGMADVWITYELPPPGLGSSCKYLVIGSDGILDIDAYGAVRLAGTKGWELLHEQAPFRYRDLVADEADLFGPLRLRAFADQLQDFERAASAGSPLAFTMQDARAGVGMVEAAAQSALLGRSVGISGAAAVQSTT